MRDKRTSCSWAPSAQLLGNPSAHPPLRGSRTSNTPRSADNSLSTTLKIMRPQNPHRVRYPTVCPPGHIALHHICHTTQLRTGKAILLRSLRRPAIRMPLILRLSQCPPRHNLILQ